MNSIREVLRLHLITNLSARKIQGATGVARTTIQEYIKRCKESGIYSYEELYHPIKIRQHFLNSYSHLIYPMFFIK